MPANDRLPQIRIRKARQSDAPRLAELATQLGYPTTPRQMVKRLKLVLPQGQAACFVATRVDNRGITGWVHVSVTPLLEVELRAEINGLVVDEQIRSQGTGRLLLNAAERWAKKLGAQSMSLRSNVLRLRAHGFYERNGYEHYKTQKAFRKTL